MDMEIINLPTLNNEILESTKILYHGTAIQELTCDFNLIKNIKFNRNIRKCDFGPGFYLTLDLPQAQKRAESKVRHYRSNNEPKQKMKHNVLEEEGLSSFFKEGKQTQKLNPVVIEYPFQYKGSFDLKAKIFSKPDDEWIDFIYCNRSDSSSLDEQSTNHNLDCKYDIVFGYMADGYMKELERLFLKEYSEVTKSDFELLRSTFLASKDSTGNQISLHCQDAVECCLLDGAVKKIS